jgi:hypothetical protein
MVNRARQEPLFYVVGVEKCLKAYYAGWWHTYRQPLFTHNHTLGAKAMTRANANRVRRRLENPSVWGGSWSIEPVQ